MTIHLDNPTSTRPPVLSTRGFGLRGVGMIVDKEQRARKDQKGDPILSKLGRPTYEEVLTVTVLEGTTGTITDGHDERVPKPGELVRLIFKGPAYAELIDARKRVGGNTQVGDVVTVTTTSATTWRGAGDMADRNVTDPDVVRRARDKSWSVSWNVTADYRRPRADELGLVEEAEAHHHELRPAITLPDDDAFA